MIATFGNYTWSWFLPIYYSNTFGASPVLIGFLYTCWYALIAIGSTPAGILADRYGRKPVVASAGFISTVGVLLLAFSHSLIISGIAFLFTGLGTGFLQISNVIVTESVEKERRGTAMGTFQLFTYLTAGFSPIVGGVALSHNYDFYPLFIFGAILSLVAALGRTFLVKETLKRDDETALQKRPSLLANLNKLFTDRTLLSILLAYAFYNFFANQQSFVVSLYTHNVLDLNTVNMGGIFFIIIEISAISRLPFGKLSDKIGRLQTIALSWIGESSFVFIFVLAPKGNLEIASIGIGLWQLFGVMDGPAVNAWIADIADPASRGVSMGVFYTGSLLLYLPGVISTGILYAIRPQLPFYANSALGFACLLMLVLVNRTHFQKSGITTAKK